MTKERCQVVDSWYAKRNPKYGKIIKAIEGEGVCPFCPGKLKYHTNPVLRSTSEWFLTENFMPYENAGRHFLIIGKRHQEQFDNLIAQDFIEVRALAKWAIRKFDIRGGALALRFGETRFTGATVVHLHFHLIEPSVKRNGRARTVLFPIG